MLLSIGDQIKPGSYRPHSRFQPAVNFEREDRLVSVVDETIGPGPLNIVLRDLPARLSSIPSLKECPPLRVGPKTVLFAGHRYPFTSRHRYDSTLDLQGVDLHRLHHYLSVLGKVLKQEAPLKSLAFLIDAGRRKHFRAGVERAFVEQITRGVRQVFRGDLLEGIRHLKGCGLGLTPSGDDFIAGLLIGLHVRQKLRGRDFQPAIDAVFRAAQGNNIFSNTFLDLARRDLVFGRMKDLILALVAGREGAVRRAAGKLFAVGETSGADLATGLLMTLQSEGRGQWSVTSD